MLDILLDMQLDISDCIVGSLEYVGNLTADRMKIGHANENPQLGVADHSKRAKRAQLQ
jgi:hypothetical protein